MQLKQKLLKIAYCSLFMISLANLCFAFADSSDSWYQALRKPAFQPPDIVFIIVWTALFISITASMSLINLKPNPAPHEVPPASEAKKLQIDSVFEKKAAPLFATPKEKSLFLYALSGILCVLWTYVFFRQHNSGGAVFLLIAIIATAVLLFSDVLRTDKTAAYLLIPYLFWLCFMLCLNYEVAFLN